MGGWMDGWMNEWMDRWMDEWTAGSMDGWMSGYEWTAGWMDERLDGWMSKSRYSDHEFRTSLDYQSLEPWTLFNQKHPFLGGSIKFLTIVGYVC